MRVYVGFDDTDVVDGPYGTGKLVRRFENSLPDGCSLWGVVRQQLLIDDRIPYTSHNSSACAVIEMPDASFLQSIIARAIEHIERQSSAGSDPGLCVAGEHDPAMPRLIELGRLCTANIVTQKEVLSSAKGIHLSGHGGTNDGIIGAAAAVGLTVSGWSGRFIEYGKLRDFPEQVTVSELERSGIRVVSVDRDTMLPGYNDIVCTEGWLRPRLWGFRPVVPVKPAGNNRWNSLGEKKRNNNKEGRNEYAW
jgi:tRNA(Ile2) C34 agmatinyltransferase TiaS